MNTAIIIFIVIGIIMWFDNKRRNKRIKEAWDFARSNRFTSCVTNNGGNSVHSKNVERRMQLRLDVEKVLISMGHDVTTDGVAGNTKADILLDEIFNSYKLNTNPAIMEVVTEFTNRLELTSKKKESIDDKILLETIREVAGEFKPVEEKNVGAMANINDATTALKKLGYKSPDIKKAIHIIMNTAVKIPTVGDIVRKALVILNN